MAVLYADAFYLDGENRHKAGFIPSSARLTSRSRQQNGWGFVLRLGSEVYYDYAEVPAEVLRAFVTRKAFIYALEVVAQVIALAAFGRWIPSAWIAFIDNVAGQCALSKGYGRDSAVNGILTIYLLGVGGTTRLEASLRRESRPRPIRRTPSVEPTSPVPERKAGRESTRHTTASCTSSPTPPVTWSTPQTRRWQTSRSCQMSGSNLVPHFESSLGGAGGCSGAGFVRPPEPSVVLGRVGIASVATRLSA